MLQFLKVLDILSFSVFPPSSHPLSFLFVYSSVLCRVFWGVCSVVPRLFCFEAVSIPLFIIFLKKKLVWVTIFRQSSVIHNFPFNLVKPQIPTCPGKLRLTVLIGGHPVNLFFTYRKFIFHGEELPFQMLCLYSVVRNNWHTVFIKSF